MVLQPRPWIGLFWFLFDCGVVSVVLTSKTVDGFFLLFETVLVAESKTVDCAASWKPCPSGAAPAN